MAYMYQVCIAIYSVKVLTAVYKKNVTTFGETLAMYAQEVKFILLWHLTLHSDKIAVNG